MVKTIIKAIYSAFISIILISIVLAGWTGYVFVSQSSKSGEIMKVIQDMYSNQKSVLVDVIDLSKILIKNTTADIDYKNNDLLLETELETEREEYPKVENLPITEDNWSNTLGIVIEPYIPKANENILPELIEEPLVTEKNDFSENKMDTKMDMNS